MLSLLSSTPECSSKNIFHDDNNSELLRVPNEQTLPPTSTPMNTRQNIAVSSSNSRTQRSNAAQPMREILDDTPSGGLPQQSMQLPSNQSNGLRFKRICDARNKRNSITSSLLIHYNAVEAPKENSSWRRVSLAGKKVDHENPESPNPVRRATLSSTRLAPQKVHQKEQVPTEPSWTRRLSWFSSNAPKSGIVKNESHRRSLRATAEKTIRSAPLLPESFVESLQAYYDDDENDSPVALPRSLIKISDHKISDHKIADHKSQQQTQASPEKVNSLTKKQASPEKVNSVTKIGSPMDSYDSKLNSLIYQRQNSSRTPRRGSVEVVTPQRNVAATRRFSTDVSAIQSPSLNDESEKIVFVPSTRNYTFSSSAKPPVEEIDNRPKTPTFRPEECFPERNRRGSLLGAVNSSSLQNMSMLGSAGRARNKRSSLSHIELKSEKSSIQSKEPAVIVKNRRSSVSHLEQKNEQRSPAVRVKNRRSSVSHLEQRNEPRSRSNSRNRRQSVDTSYKHRDHYAHVQTPRNYRSSSQPASIDRVRRPRSREKSSRSKSLSHLAGETGREEESRIDYMVARNANGVGTKLSPHDASNFRANTTRRGSMTSAPTQAARRASMAKSSSRRLSLGGSPMTASSHRGTSTRKYLPHVADNHGSPLFLSMTDIDIESNTKRVKTKGEKEEAYCAFAADESDLATSSQIRSGSMNSFSKSPRYHSMGSLRDADSSSTHNRSLSPFNRSIHNRSHSTDKPNCNRVGSTDSLHKQNTEDCAWPPSLHCRESLDSIQIEQTLENKLARARSNDKFCANGSSEMISRHSTRDRRSSMNHPKRGPDLHGADSVQALAIEDKNLVSPTRRGTPCSHRSFGVAHRRIARGITLTRSTSLRTKSNLDSNSNHDPASSQYKKNITTKMEMRVARRLSMTQAPTALTPSE